MDQSPKAKFLRPKYLALERERQWYWRVYLGLKTCCLQKKDKLAKKEDTEYVSNNAQDISVPILIEIQRMVDMRQTDLEQAEAIKRLVEKECHDAIRNITEIQRKMASNRLTKIQYAEEKLEREEEIDPMDQDERKVKDYKHDSRPWARRKHYYNENSYDLGSSDNLGDDERLPYYKPYSRNHLEQGFKPWARRRHYFNHTQDEDECPNHFSEDERYVVNNPSGVQTDSSKPWARRRYYFNVSRAIADITVEEDYKPWARRRHYYNEGRDVAGSDKRVGENNQEISAAVFRH